MILDQATVPKRLGDLKIVALFVRLGVVVCCVGFVLCVGRSRVLVCLLTCPLCVRGFLKAEILVLFFGFFEPKFEEENQTQSVGAGGGIRTPVAMAISPSYGFFSLNIPFLFLALGVFLYS